MRVQGTACPCAAACTCGARRAALQRVRRRARQSSLAAGARRGVLHCSCTRVCRARRSVQHALHGDTPRRCSRAAAGRRACPKRGHAAPLSTTLHGPCGNTSQQPTSSLPPPLLLPQISGGCRGAPPAPPQPHHPLAGLPERPGQPVVAGRWPRLPRAAVGEVAAAEALQAGLRRAVHGRLGALGRVAEAEPGQRQEKRLQPQRRVAEQIGVDEPWGGRKRPRRARWGRDPRGSWLLCWGYGSGRERVVLARGALLGVVPAPGLASRGWWCGDGRCYV